MTYTYKTNSNFHKPKKAEKIDSHKIRFDFDKMKKVCLASEDDLQSGEFDWSEFNLPAPEIHKVGVYPHMFFDRGGDVLAVAHMDSYGEGTYHFELVDFSGERRVYCANLDDRLGAYIILDLLNNSYGFNYDILLTWGEETGQSSAMHFETVKQYNWVFEFDRTGTDMVMYEYEDTEMVNLIKKYGWRVGLGSFTDICYLQHLGCKAFNFGCAYEDYHGKYAYTSLNELAWSVNNFLEFFVDQQNNFMPHTEVKYKTQAWNYYDNDYQTWGTNIPSKTTASNGNGSSPTVGKKHTSAGWNDWDRIIETRWKDQRGEEAIWFDKGCSECGFQTCYGELVCWTCLEVFHNDKFLYDMAQCEDCYTAQKEGTPHIEDLGCEKEGCDIKECTGIQLCTSCNENVHNDPYIEESGSCFQCWELITGDI